jgi:hypothetical protein
MTIFENHHLGVFMETAVSDAFRLGTSALGGADTLGNEADSYQFVNYRDFLTEVNIDNGVNVTGPLAQPEGNICVVTLQSTSDPLDQGFIRIGNKLKLTLENYVPGVDSQTFWQGKIRSITRDIDENQNYRVVITAGDYLSEITSTNVEHFTAMSGTGPDGDYVTAQSIWTYINLLLPADLQFNTSRAMVYDVDPTTQPTWPQMQQLPAFDQYDVTLDAIIEQAADVNQFWLVSNLDGELMPVSNYYLFRRQITGIPVATFTPVCTFTDSWNDSQIAVTYLNRNNNTDGMFNTYKLALSWDTLTTLSLTDQDSVDLYGPQVIEKELNVINEAGLTEFSKWLARFRTASQVKSLVVDAYDHRNHKLTDVWKLYPSELVDLDITAAGETIAYNALVSRVRHTITPDTWQSEIELIRMDY